MYPRGVVASLGRPYSIENRTGRLVEARVYRLRTRVDVDAYAHELGVQTLRVPGSQRSVLCADHRPVAIYAEPVAARLIELFTHMNTRLERVAILASPSNATLKLQLSRLVREAAFPARRVFYAAEEAQEHLAPVLDAAELARMRAFLQEYAPPTAPRR